MYPLFKKGDMVILDFSPIREDVGIIKNVKLTISGKTYIYSVYDLNTKSINYFTEERLKELGNK
jgi:hypothetical protein